MTSETDEFTFAEQQHAPPPRPRTPLPVSRRASTWAVAGVGLILAGVLSASGPIYPSLEDGVAWNILDLDLRREPEVMWVAEVANGEVLGELDGAIVSRQGNVIYSDDEEAHPSDLVGLDAATGAERWRIEDTDHTCEIGSGAVTCTEHRASPDAIVTIYSADASTSTSVDHPGAMSARALDDGGLLVVEGGTTALADLVRLDAAGNEVWRSQLSFSGLADSGYSHIDVLGDAAIATAGGSVDLATGGEPTSYSPWFGDTDVNGTARQPTTDGATEVMFTDGATLVVPPEEMWLDVDDAFGGPVSLQGDEITIVAAWDGGQTTHEVGQPHCWLQARLQGALVQTCFNDGDLTDSTVMAVDQLTGEQLWERTSSLGSSTFLASTDTLVLSTDGAIEGVDPRTGESRWSIPVPGQFPRTTTEEGDLVIPDGLLVWTDEALMRLG